MKYGAGVSPNQALVSNTDQWLMIDVSLISLDGSTCNRVGTSYSAFQFQAVSPHSAHTPMRALKPWKLAGP
jgi:hypothetical protein